MEQKLVVFDVDGVLIDTKIGGLKDILTILGKGAKVEKLEEEYQKRKKFGPWGLDELVLLYKGFSKMRMSNIATKYCEQNLMKGASEAIAELKLNDFLVGAISSEADFVVDVLARNLSLDFTCGTVLEYTNGICTGKIIEKVDRFTKAELLKKIMQEKNISRSNIYVVGDSITDLPMGQVAGRFIGFRPKTEIIEHVNFIVREKDLEKILPLLIFE